MHTKPKDTELVVTLYTLRLRFGLIFLIFFTQAPFRGRFPLSLNSINSVEQNMEIRLTSPALLHRVTYKPMGF